jgi:putative membrane protein
MKQSTSFFSETQQNELAEAVRKAEAATSGEIVPYVVRQSDSYPEAALRAGSLLALLSLAVFTVLRVMTDLWLPFSIFGVSIVAVISYGAAFGCAAIVPACRRWFISGRTMRERVEERASMAFLSEEVFATKNRTGILLFISLFEHQVRVIGDRGITTLVKQEEWDGVVSILVDSMKRGKPYDGLMAAIAECGRLLEHDQVTRQPDDTNELDDAVRFSDK